MPHDVRTCLYDIKTHITAIESYLSENLGGRRDFNAYMKNQLLRRGIERELEIIGEAAKRIRDTNPDFPLENIREIIGLRNRITHTYDNDADAFIWAILIRHLAPLRKEVERLLISG